MKLIKPYIEVLDQKEGLDGMYKMIECAGRTCYKSESNITPDSSKGFVDRMIKSGHYSMLEHGTVYLKLEGVFLDPLDVRVSYGNYLVSQYINNKYSKVVIKHDEEWKSDIYITTNYRELVKNNWLKDLEYICEPTEYHKRRAAVKFVCNRAIANEYVRHRTFSFAQESTRYCVSGNTVLTYKNPHWNYTIKELYNKTLEGNGSWKRLLVRNLNEETGELVYSKIKNIFYNGIKPTYRIVTELGYTLQCTSDHKIYTPRGYIELMDLDVGDSIYVNGIIANSDSLYKNQEWLYYQNITLNKTFVEIAKEFNYNVNTVKKWARKLGIPKKGTGYFNVGKTPWNKGLSEKDDIRVKRQAEALREYHYDSSKKGESIMKVDTSKYQKYMKDSCEVCGGITNLEVHHKDKNRSNNDPSNLLTVCESCHSRIHSQNLTILHTDKIISIEECGEEEVYDLEMENFSNYIANGVIVHNCNYSADRFDNELTFIIPSNLPNLEEGRYEETTLVHKGNKESIEAIKVIKCIEGTKAWNVQLSQEGSFLELCLSCEEKYFEMLNKFSWSPQQARDVLPNALKTELVMTGFISDWVHFLNLRHKGTTGAPHPDAKVLAGQVREEFIKRGYIES